MVFNPSAVSPDDIVEIGGGKTYPFFQWVSKSTTGTLVKGGFLFKSDQSTGEFVFPGTPESVNIINGPELTGYTFKGLHVAILGVRQDWYYQNINESNKKTFADSYDGALKLARGAAQYVKGRTQILALVKQLAPWYGPVLLTSSGVVGRTFDTIVKQEWPNKFINPVARLYKQTTLPLWMFWAPLTTTSKEVRANPKYATTVVHPKLVLPEAITEDVVDKAYIGDDLAAIVRGLLPEVREWMTAKITANLGEPVISVSGAGSDGPDWDAPATSDGGVPGKQATFQRASVEEVPWD